MRVKDYELIRCNDGGEVRVWYDGQIDILKESHMTVGFREAKRRQTLPPEALRSLCGSRVCQTKCVHPEDLHAAVGADAGD